MANKILITGGTGLIGQKITKRLTELGYTIHILTRSFREDNENVKYFLWDIAKQEIDEQAFDGVDHIIHLVGASIAKRWTQAYKKVVISSRVESANLLYKTLKRRGQKLKVLVSASASGFYPPNTGQIMNEEAQPGKGFLAKVCKQWEAAANQFNDICDRVVIHRIGVVLAKEGGALEKMLAPFRLGLAPYFGNGNQYYPWMHVDDVANQFVFAITNHIEGVFNANTSNITQRQLNEQIALALNKKVLHIPTPVFALQLAMGDMQQIVTNSTQMSNYKIRKAGFQSQYETIENALGQLF